MANEKRIEIEKLKNTAEKKITDLIREFEKETGLYIEKIDLVHFSATTLKVSLVGIIFKDE